MPDSDTPALSGQPSRGFLSHVIDESYAYIGMPPCPACGVKPHLAHLKPPPGIHIVDGRKRGDARGATARLSCGHELRDVEAAAFYAGIPDHYKPQPDRWPDKPDGGSDA